MQSIHNLLADERKRSTRLVALWHIVGQGWARRGLIDVPWVRYRCQLPDRSILLSLPSDESHARTARLDVSRERRKLISSRCASGLALCFILTSLYIDYTYVY